MARAAALAVDKTIALLIRSTIIMIYIYAKVVPQISLDVFLRFSIVDDLVLDHFSL
jgi:hypothetical protein